MMINIFKVALSFLLLFTSAQSFGQTNVKELDDSVSNRIKGRLKIISTGKRSNGLGIFYYKSNKSVFGVTKNEWYKSNNRNDSSSSFSANFRNDTLFRIVIKRKLPSEKQGRVIMYLDGDKIVAQEVIGFVYIPEISTLKEKSYQLLYEAKELIKAQ
jgi:hypothetical protein